MRATHLVLFVISLLIRAPISFAGEPSLLTFVKEPVATRHANKVLIKFETDRECDVAVYVENEKGEVVRHLVAGMLGRNAPDPLKPDTLQQSVSWDGNDDDGKQASGGPFKVRVGLGLKASWGGTAFAEQSGPDHIGSVNGLAAGHDGRVYVMDNRSGWLYWPAHAVHVFLRDGSYEKTIKPFPSNLPLERLGATGAFRNDRGYLNPLIHRPLAMTFYPFEDAPAAQMAVTPAGRLILAVVPTQSGGRGDTAGNTAHLAAIDGDGGVPLAGYAGPALGKGLVYRGNSFAGGARMAASTDGKYIYIVNIGNLFYDNGYQLKRHPAVYRVPLRDLGPAEVFFGDKDHSGNDEKHLNEPMGVATDGHGQLFVADCGNNRVVVIRESDGSMADSFPVASPAWVGVHSKTGAIYVHSQNRLVKFSGDKDHKEMASLDFSKKAYAGLGGWRKDKQALCFALNASAEPAAIWMGMSMPAAGQTLLRCEDQGSSFSDLQPAKYYASRMHSRPASDPTHRMILCGKEILDESSGHIRQVSTQPGLGNNQGTQFRLDRDGNLYASSASGGIWKLDRNGKRLPFPATASDPALKGHLPGGSTGTTAWERDWYVDRKGDIYAKVRGTQYHGMMHVDVFAPDGTRKRTVLFGVTDGAYGPRVDPQGNIYLMECVKPVGQPFPDQFAPYATDRWVKHWYDWIYGSIVKFPPAGGNIWVKNLSEKNKPRAEPVSLPESAPKEKVNASFRGDENLMQGHLWMAPGVAHVGDMGVAGANGGEHCHCTGCDFDVDDFGRSFAPDNGRQRVTVFDTNGNVILHFGAYGNQDYCGPDSYVFDEKVRAYRPRNPDDPKEMKSPFAEPEIAFNWIVGLAVTDKHAYVADTANRRMLKVKLEYQSEQVIPIPKN